LNVLPTEIFNEDEAEDVREGGEEEGELLECSAE